MSGFQYNDFFGVSENLYSLSDTKTKSQGTLLSLERCADFCPSRLVSNCCFLKQWFLYKQTQSKEGTSAFRSKCTYNFLVAEKLSADSRQEGTLKEINGIFRFWRFYKHPVVFARSPANRQHFVYHDSRPSF